MYVCSEVIIAFSLYKLDVRQQKDLQLLLFLKQNHYRNKMINVHRAIVGGFGHLCNGAALDLDWRRPSYLAKLLNAADWGLMHNGTLLVFNCSAINLCISSEMN